MALTLSLLHKVVVHCLLCLNRPHQDVEGHLVFAYHNIVSALDPVVDEIHKRHCIIPEIVIF